ncbi:hypothetical protein BGZ94_002965 [Podila epigama]|nr:hypothetical protein BGZ94_002965 [Podila epigama]
MYHQECALLEANPGLLSLYLDLRGDSPDYSPSLTKSLTALRHLIIDGGNLKDLRPGFLKSILDSNQHLESLDARPFLEDYLNVIQATSNLVQLRLPMNSFSTVMCDALLHGSAHSLEVLFLDIRGESSAQESIVSAGRILSSCPKLQHLQLAFDSYPTYSDGLEKPLTAQPWICSNLKTITMITNQLFSAFCMSSCECKTSEEARTIGVACDTEIQKQGWEVVDYQYKDRHVPWECKRDRLVLFTAASALPHVNKVSLGDQIYEHVERSLDGFTIDIDWT